MHGAMPEPTRSVALPEQLKVRLARSTKASLLSEHLRGFFQTCHFFDLRPGASCACAGAARCLLVGQQRFPVHRAVLAGLCEGLQRFLRDVPRAALNCTVEHLPVVPLEIQQPEAVLVLLDFAYDLGGSFELDLQVLRDVIRLVQMFGLKHLEDHVVTALGQQINFENIMEILAISVEFRLSSLYRLAFEILQLSGHLKTMSRSKAILEYPELMQHMLLHMCGKQ